MQKFRYQTVILCTLMLFNIVMGQSTDLRDRKNEEYLRALDLFEKEKYASAQHAFEKIIAEKSLNFDINTENSYYYAAVCSQLLSNQDAKIKLDEFIRRYPQSSKVNMAHFFLANHHYANKDYKNALAEYRKVDDSQIDFGHRSEYEFKVGYCLFQNGEAKDAKPYFSRIMQGKSKYSNSALYYYAHIQYEEESYDLALANFQKLQKDKKFAKIVPYYIAQIYYFLDKEEDLIAMAPELIANSNDARKSEIEQMVGEVCYRKGEYAQALKYFEQANAYAQQDNEYQMGFCYYQLQKYDSAIVCFRHFASENDSIAQNALYHLADIYVKTNQKPEALTVFRQVANMNYNEKIKEDALFNYAKLSCEIGRTPFNESIQLLQNHLTQYPKTSHKNEINELLTSLYFSTRNYKNALELIEKLPEKTHSLNQAYQRIALNRGIELFNGNDIDNAEKLFSKTIKINALAKVTTDAYYLRGECYYRKDQFSKAKNDLDKFFVTSSAQQSQYNLQAQYTLGYTNYKLKNYAMSVENFKKFTASANTADDKRQIDDANNRIADGYFIQKKFNDAIFYYNKVIASRGVDADYACYQKALSYGALGQYNDKISCLNNLLATYPNSSIAPSATFEIAGTYLLNDDDSNALRYYEQYLDKYPNSSYAKEALLKTGIIHYNASRETEALTVFDKILGKYPGTPESRDALLTVKNIYSNQGRIDEYFTYVQKTTNVVISDIEQDSMTFVSAEGHYFSGETAKAVNGLKNYLKKFPNGLFKLNATYYLADCLYRDGKNEEALPYYEYVASQAKSKYTETSLRNAAIIAYNSKSYAKANSLFMQLAQVSEIEGNIQLASMGAMRTFYELTDYQNVIERANVILSSEKYSTEDREEAAISKARAFYTLGYTDSAMVAYRTLRNSDNGEYSGEAAYREAESYFKKKDYANAELAIDEAISDPHSDYWAAKTFILWADIFHINGNDLQAKQTLQSIIDNYDGEDLVLEATAKLNEILQEEEMKKNIENPENQKDEEIIDINE